MVSCRGRRAGPVRRRFKGSICRTGWCCAIRLRSVRNSKSRCSRSTARSRRRRRIFFGSARRRLNSGGDAAPPASSWSSRDLIAGGPRWLRPVVPPRQSVRPSRCLVENRDRQPHEVLRGDRVARQIGVLRQRDQSIRQRHRTEHGGVERFGLLYPVLGQREHGWLPSRDFLSRRHNIAGEKLQESYFSVRPAEDFGGEGFSRAVPLWASLSARTRKAEASGVDPSRSASTSATRPARPIARDLAASSSTCQNSASSATLVRCPASEKLRLIRLLSSAPRLIEAWLVGP